MARRLTAACLAAALLALAGAGCALGPNYKRPAVPTPPTWREIPAAEAESLANTTWWTLYDDPLLQELIRIALVENKDLKIAVERIEEARARYGFAKADFWPWLDVGGAAARVRTREQGIFSGEQGDGATLDRGVETPVYAAAASVSWELDFFGRIRRTTESQKALFLGTMEARRAAVLTLVADVARAYFELRDFDRRLEISRRTITSRREYREIAKDRFEGGITPEIDFRQAEAELRRVETIVFDLERLIALKENELSVLLGRNPGAVVRGRAADAQTLPAAVPAGLPAALLDRRPDVREAEQSLAAFTANIGAAKALLWPRIALTGSYGFASSDLDTLFEGPAKSWNIVAGLLQPIFNAGKNRRRVEVTESQQRQALYAYERAILEAFRETEDALVAYRKTGEQRTAQKDRVLAERKVLELAELRYRGGVAAYLEVLDAQRSLFNAELEEAQTIGSHLVSLVRLYKALGGGWPSAPDAAPTASTATP
jgi:multidrug efflux system outer membrane protein